MSGPAIGALVTGIVSLLVTMLVAVFGLIAAQSGVGALVGGAFAVLAAALGGAGVGLGLVGLRQMRTGGVRGRGMAIAGVICGGVAILLTVLVMVLLVVSG